MRVSDNSYALDVQVTCRGGECTGEKSQENVLIYTVPEYNDIKIKITNAGEKTIELTAHTKKTTWELLKGRSLNTVCSQAKGENGIGFGNGHFHFELQFINP